MLNKLGLGLPRSKMFISGSNIFKDATVAYSLRDLGLGATNVVRVRRSLDNAEQDFTANEITDGTLTSFCGVGDGFVSVWYNQKSETSHLIQPNAVNQPKIVDLGSLILINGKPALYAIDKTKFMYAPYTFQSGDILACNINVCQPEFLGGVSIAYSSIHPAIFTSGDRQTIQPSLETTTNTATRYEGGNVIYNASIATGNQYIQVTNRTVLNTEFDQRINGLDLTIASSSLAQNLNIQADSAFTIFKGGAGGYDTEGTALVQGYLHESIWYLDDKSNQIIDIETNINNYYGIY
jgi:hypothetical protein